MILGGSPGRTPAQPATVILAYHRVVAGAPESPLAVSRRAFESQMKTLLDWGARPRRLEDLPAPRPRRTALRPAFFAVTFDDAYEETLTVASPILQALGIPATVFAVTALVGSAHPFPWEMKRPSARTPGRSLGWSGLREILRRGHSIGSHTCTHPELTEIPTDVAWGEISKSRRDLESRLGVRIESFCYPRGDLDAGTVAGVARAGYRVGVVTPPQPGIPETGLTRHRVGIYAHDGPLTFRLKMTPLLGVWRRHRWALGRGELRSREAA